MRLHDKLVMDAAKTQAQLRILETTDLHVNLLPYDYFTDRPAPSIGLAHAASLVRMLRDQVDNCLLFDNGDFLQGNPLSDWIAHDAGFTTGDLHPMIAAMNVLGYDAATLGNHEFDYGLDFLTDAIALATFPIVSANITAQGRPLVAPYVILDRQIIASDGLLHRIKVGVIGFAPPQLIGWNRMVLQGRVAACSILEAAQTYVPQMRAAGADIVIALSHSGIGSESAAADMENASVPLAAVPGIDAILTGHTHLIFPGPGFNATGIVDPCKGTLHGKPAVMAGSNGSHVGVIDLVLECDGIDWAVIAHTARVEPIADRDAGNQVTSRVPVDAQILAAATAGHDAILSLIRRPVGATHMPLHSHFALVAPDLTVQVVADAQMAHAAQVLRGTEWADLPLLSAVAPSKVGGLGGPDNFIDIPPGPLAMRHAAELYVFPNTLCLLTLTGADLREWLEQSAGIFAPITPGQTDQPLLHPEFPCYNFDVIAGVTYVIDPSQPSRTDPSGRVINPGSRRICDLHCNGIKVEPTQPFVIATNSYRVGGGGGFDMARRARIIHHSVETIRDILILHLARNNPLSIIARPVWQFAPLHQTAAWFDCGPGAVAHLADPGAVALQGPTPDDTPVAGKFRRFTIRF